MIAPESINLSALPSVSLRDRGRLHIVMAERRMSPSDLAEKMGVNRVFVSRLKNAKLLMLKAITMNDYGISQEDVEVAIRYSVNQRLASVEGDRS